MNDKSNQVPEMEINEAVIVAALIKTGVFDISEAQSYINKFLSQSSKRAELENKRLLYALALMYSQYCGSKPYGHDFMGAGETAITILEEYDIADELTGVNDKKLDKLESELNQLKAKGE